MNHKTLRQLYAEHTGKVSEKWSSYLNKFDLLFNDYREKSVHLLEIGVQNGGSLEIWSKYFSHKNSVLMGCDINPDCEQLRYDDPRIGIVVGNATDPEIHSRIMDTSTPFDIIIDDGSHRSSDMIKTFSLYFPYLAHGGLYIVEDIHCSYWESFEGGLFSYFSAITFFKRLADMTNYENWIKSGSRTDYLQGVFGMYNCRIEENVLSRIESVEFMNSLCMIRKTPEASETKYSKYRRLLTHCHANPIRLLKTGIPDAHSQENWFTDFNQDPTLTGYGTNVATAQSTFNDRRISIVSGNMDRPGVHEEVIRLSPEYDIIISNGIQTSRDFIRTFALYFPILADDGIFILEDVHQSYQGFIENKMIEDPFSAFTFFARLADVMNHDHWGYSKSS